MTVQFSTGLANAMLDGQLNSGSGASFADSQSLKIYSGSAPALANTAESGSLLATITLPADAFAAASAKACAKSGTWSTTASGTGTAGYYRIVGSGDDGTLSTTQKRIQGTCGQGSGDLSLDNTSIATGQTVTISSYSVGIT